MFVILIDSTAEHFTPDNCALRPITSPGLITSALVVISAGTFWNTAGLTLQSRIAVSGEVVDTNLQPESKYFRVFCESSNLNVSVNKSTESPAELISIAEAPMIVPVSAKIFIDSIKEPAGNLSPGGFKLLQSSQGRVVGLVIALSRALGSLSSFSTPIITPILAGLSQPLLSNSSITS